MNPCTISVYGKFVIKKRINVAPWWSCTENRSNYFQFQLGTVVCENRWQMGKESAKSRRQSLLSSAITIKQCHEQASQIRADPPDCHCHFSSSAAPLYTITRIRSRRLLSNDESSLQERKRKRQECSGVMAYWRNGATAQELLKSSREQGRKRAKLTCSTHAQHLPHLQLFGLTLNPPERFLDHLPEFLNSPLF